MSALGAKVWPCGCSPQRCGAGRAPEGRGFTFAVSPSVCEERRQQKDRVETLARLNKRRIVFCSSWPLRSFPTPPRIRTSHLLFRDRPTLLKERRHSLSPVTCHPFTIFKPSNGSLSIISQVPETLHVSPLAACTVLELESQKYNTMAVITSCSHQVSDWYLPCNNWRYDQDKSYNFVYQVHYITERLPASNQKCWY